MFTQELAQDNFLDELNQAQQQAVTSRAQHLLVLAGAGSGKTRVLVHRIAWLMIHHQVMPSRIIAVTFTNKAATEMRHRIEKVVGSVTSRLWVGTFHGLSHRILRQHAEQAGLPENFQIIDTDDQLRLIKRLIQERGWSEETYEPKRVLSFINRHKDEGKRANAIIPSALPEITAFTELYRLYEQHCQRSGIVDFAEILLRAYELWRDNPALLAQYQQRFSHILVDEFQDTNTIQYAWLKQLCGQDNQIMIVGDDDQSIYGWRGAKIENIHRFSKDFKEAVTIRLEQNYRSTSTILTAANALIAQNESRLGKELWTQGVQGERLTLYGAFNEIDEARFIVERIRQWCNQGGSYENTAILYRSNAQSRVLEQTLRQSNIPYRVFGGLRFFDRAEIKDTLAYLRLLANCGDDTAFERVINLPPRGIGERTLASIRDYAQQHQISLWHAAKAYYPTLPLGRISNGVRQFFECIEEMMSCISQLTLAELVQRVLQRSGLLEYVKTQPGEKTQARVENLHELVQASSQFHLAQQEMLEKIITNSNETLPGFLSEVALDAGDREGGETEACVKLMTLHSAKGLEFPLVFLSGMEDGLFPHHRCFHERTLLEEERRLCYVGITRAMRKVYLSYAEKRSFAGLSGVNRPSRFIDEIPANLIEKISLNISVTAPVLSSPSRNKLNNFPFALGQRVNHARFGQGVVLNGEGEGESARVQVNFAKEGKKWLLLAYAKLETVD